MARTKGSFKVKQYLVTKFSIAGDQLGESVLMEASKLSDLTSTLLKVSGYEEAYNMYLQSIGKKYSKTEFKQSLHTDFDSFEGMGSGVVYWTCDFAESYYFLIENLEIMKKEKKPLMGKLA